MAWIVTDDTFVEVLPEEDAFFADAFDGFTLTLSARKSQHPAAKDANKSDHISLQPKRLDLEGCIGDRAFSKNRDLFQGESDRTAAACNLLESLWRSRECCTVNVKGKSFTNMVLLNAPMRCTVGNKLTFTLSFEEFETYGVSETFEATIGRKVDLGEVATTQGQPVISEAIEDLQAALDQFNGTQQFPDCEFASQTQCLDDFYAGFN